MADRRNRCYSTRKRSTRTHEESGRRSRALIQIATRQYQPCTSAKSRRPHGSALKASASSPDSVTISTTIATSETMRAPSTTTATFRATSSIPTQTTPQMSACTRKRIKRSNTSTSSMAALAGAALKELPRFTPRRSQRK